MSNAAAAASNPSATAPVVIALSPSKTEPDTLEVRNAAAVRLWQHLLTALWKSKLESAQQGSAMESSDVATGRKRLRCAWSESPASGSGKLVAEDVEHMLCGSDCDSEPEPETKPKLPVVSPLKVAATAVACEDGIVTAAAISTGSPTTVTVETLGVCPPAESSAASSPLSPSLVEPVHATSPSSASIVGSLSSPTAAANLHKNEVDAMRNGPLSLLDTFTAEQIDKHVSTLQQESFLMQYRLVLQRLMEHSANGGVFNQPVDAEALGIPEYHTTIKHPMDLGTIRQRLEAGLYTDDKDVLADMQLTFANAKLFNPPGHPVHVAAQRLEEELEQQVRRINAKGDSEKQKKEAHKCSACQRQQCMLCGDKCLRFDPPVLYCDHCCDRIRRSAFFYRAATGERWCARCVTNRSCFRKAKPEVDPRMPTKPILPPPPTPLARATSCPESLTGHVTPVPDVLTVDTQSASTTPTSTASLEFPLTSPSVRRSSRIESRPPADMDAMRLGVRHVPPKPAPPRPVVTVREQPRVVLKVNLQRLSLRAEVIPPPPPPPKPTSARARSRLEKRRNDEVVTEPWVQCDVCQQWAHQLCAMFNARRQGHEATPYVCPLCRKNAPLTNLSSSVTRMYSAAALPCTPLSAELESRVRARLARLNLADVAPTLVIREVSSTAQTLDVSKEVCDLFQCGPSTYAEVYPYRQRVFLLFQTIDAVDVCLFALYVQEYGADCPPPNTRRVYIAYLDSVRYLQPLQARTEVYHEILQTYLANARLRGFLGANIWGCPPQRGDGYIFHRHPPQQRTPNKDRLRQWYVNMLEASHKEGVVGSVVSFWDHHFDSSGLMKPAAGLPPVFAGDYWYSEMQRVVDGLNGPALKLAPPKVKAKKRRRGVPSFSSETGVIIGEHPAAGTGDQPDTPMEGSVADDVSVSVDPEGDTDMTPAPEPLGDVADPSPSPVGEQPVAGAAAGAPAPAAVPNETPAARFQRAQRFLSSKFQYARDEHLVVTFAPLTGPAIPDDAAGDAISCDFFDTRHGFLRMCQGNNYQFDTLRRAKYASCMILYHLHNPHVPAFAFSCSQCERSLDHEPRFHCDICVDFCLCTGCHASVPHSHPLTQVDSSTESTGSPSARTPEAASASAPVPAPSV